jgi:hypothetical protein
MPRPLIALIAKKTSAATLRIVVMIATKLASSLKRLRNRLTTPLWRNLAQINPRPRRPTKAAIPRREMWYPARSKRGALSQRRFTCLFFSRPSGTANRETKNTAEAVS